MADGGTTTAAALITADQALPAEAGLNDDDVKFLVLAVKGGQTYAQATAALIAGQPQKLQPGAAALAAWQAEVTRRAAMVNPPYYAT
jgi:hypothetical protein